MVTNNSPEESGRPRTPPPNGPIIELRSREVIFAIIIFFLLAVVAGLVVVLSSDKIKQMESERKANTEAKDTQKKETPCGSSCSRIVKNMNKSLLPCEDFWNYSCGSFLTTETIPEGKNSFGLDNEAKENTRRNVSEVITSKVSRDDLHSAERKMKKFYKNCMDFIVSNRRGVGPFDKLVQPCGGWLTKDMTKFNESEMLILLNIKYDVSALFSMNVIKDEEEGDKNILQFSQGSLGLVKPTNYNNRTSRLAVAYRRYIRLVARAVLRRRRKPMNETMPSELDAVAKRIYRFEESLAKLQNASSSEMRRNEDQIRTNKSDFSRQFRILTEPDWRHFFDSFSKTINDSTVIVVSEWNYFVDLTKLWRNTDMSTRRDYLGWMFMSKFAAPLLTSRLWELTRDFNRQLNGRNQTREEECIEATKYWFEEVVGSEYVKGNKEFLNNETLASVQRMVENVKEIFNSTLNDSAWMDNETKAEAFKKLDKLKYNIGYPEYMTNDTELDKRHWKVDIPDSSTYFENMMSLMRNLKREKIKSLEENDQKEGWLMSIFENNAYYSFTENIVGYPAGLLQPPYYDPMALSSINYGSLATTIAHEMLHAFDSTGYMYDSEGNARVWWSNSSFNEFMQRTNCVKDTYSVMKVNGIPVNGEKTVDENMADIGGIILAYKAYHRWKEQNADDSPRIPISLRHTNEEIFFLAYAQNWCKLRRSENVEKFMRESFHSIEQIRVNGALSQVPQFQEAFKCSNKSAMAPSDRCSVW